MSDERSQSSSIKKAGEGRRNDALNPSVQFIQRGGKR